MEEIIKKAIEGGAFGNFEKVKSFNWYIGTGNEADLIFFDNGNVGIKISLHKSLMRADFWQALSKACGWEDGLGYDIKYCYDDEEIESPHSMHIWEFNALRFHEINLTEGWDEAIVYLEELTS